MPYTIYAVSSVTDAPGSRRIYVFEGTAEERQDRNEESELFADEVRESRTTVVETLEEARSVIRSDYVIDYYNRVRVHLDRLAAKQAQRSDGRIPA